MKSLLKIYGKYVSVTWVIFLLLLAFKLGTFSYILVDQAFSDDTVFIDGSRLKNLTLTKGDKGEITLSADGEKMLQDMGYVFLLILNDKEMLFIPSISRRDLKIIIRQERLPHFPDGICMTTL